MISRLFLCGLFACISHFSAAEEVTATVWTRGSVPAARALFAPGSGVKVLGAKEEAERNREAGLLPIEERNAIFRNVGVESQIVQMDEMDRDMLIMAVREYTLRELQTDYPMFTLPQLKKLKRAVEKAL
jgi:hypothetical protein